MLVDRARTKCMNHLKKLRMKFRKNMCKGPHFVKCVYMGQGTVGWGAIL